MSHVDDGTLHAYLDGELAPAEAQGVAAHAAQCPACRNRLDEERALIARADELLGLVAPPDRRIPPFRPGDLEHPARLWWQVRLPLAWAATVVLALAIGMQLGPLYAPLGKPAADRADESAAPPPATSNVPPETVAVTPAERAPVRRARQAQLPPGSAVAAARQKVQDEPAALRLQARGQAEIAAPAPPGAREEPAVGALAEQRAGRAAAPPPPPAPVPIIIVDGYQVREPVTLDSARALLGAAPFAVPGLPVRGIHQARMIGYSALVVVEQAVDSTTTIEVLSGRPASLQLEAVVVGGEARQDTARRAAQELRGRAAAGVADSVPPVARKANAALRGAQPVPADRSASPLHLEVRGPLSADSLAALQRRLQPLRP